MTAESVSFTLNEGPRRPRPRPFTLTYLGEGVVTVEGVGLFARFTTAECDEVTAKQLEQDPRWRVEPRQRR